jgi:hypothetical protein
MQTIQNIGQKIKPVLDRGVAEWGIFGLILLAAIASFGLGRLSALEDARPVVSVSMAAAAIEAPQMAPGGLLEASRTGTVYYYPWCAGVAKISPQNARWFASEKAAQAAGLRPAKNCKGLIAS